MKVLSTIGGKFSIQKFSILTITTSTSSVVEASVADGIFTTELSNLLRADLDKTLAKILEAVGNLSALVVVVVEGNCWEKS